MVKVQLIEPQVGYLDVKEGTSFPLTFSLSDIRDVGSRSSSFSKTIVLVGNDNNNELLNYYFDTNVSAGTFDINTIQRCRVLQNDVPVMENAILRLTSINILGNVVEYTATVSENRGDLFNIISNKELLEVDLSDLDHIINATNVVATFTNTQADGYKYLLPHTINEKYVLSECKPAVYAKTYFDRIFAAAGYTYEWDEATSIGFDKLLIPYNGEVPTLITSNEVIATKAAFSATGTATNGRPNNFANTFIADVEVKDDSGFYDPTTGVYANIYDCDPTAGSLIEYYIQGGLVLKLTNPYTPAAYLVGGDLSYYPVVELYRNGLLQSITPLIPAKTIKSGTPYSVGTTTTLNITFGKLFPVTPLSTGDNLTLKMGVHVYGNGRWRRTNSVSSPTVDVTFTVETSAITQRIQPKLNLSGFGAKILMGDFIPRKIKQSDFVKSILQMFNTLVLPDPFNDRNVILMSRDAYYDSGDVKDWTSKIDLSKEQTIQFASELNSKKVVLTYKEDKDAANEVYKNALEEIYGQLEFTFDSPYVKGIETKPILFSPTPIAKTSFGAILPLMNGYAPKTNIKILYDGGALSCNSYDINDIYQDDTSGELNITTYPAITHFDNPITPTYDLNFGVCDYYFYDLQNITLNNLFNLYYRRTYNQINRGKLLTCYVYLNEYDISSLSLNDKIKISNTVWNINKIIDYDAANEVVTKVELISVDDLQVNARPTRPTKPSSTTDSTPLSGSSPMLTETINAIVLGESFDSNVVSGSNVKISGRGNVVYGDNVTLVGDNNIVSSSNVIINNSDQFITLEGYDSNTLAGYYTYNCSMAQSGTSAPTQTVINNTTGLYPEWVRSSAGVYYLDFTGIEGTFYSPMTSDWSGNAIAINVHAYDGTPDLNGGYFYYWDSVNFLLYLYVVDDVGGAIDFDTLLGGSTIYLPEVRFYL